MTKFNQIKLFEEKKVRAVYDDTEEKWYFAIVDVCCTYRQYQSTNLLASTKEPPDKRRE